MRILNNKQGLTVIELMVALVIFSVTAVTLTYCLQAGDKLKSKAYVSQNATRAAANEAELIRAQAMRGISPQDTTYTTEDGRYTITREIIPPDSTGAFIKASVEIEIRVESKGIFKDPYIFKVVQGVHP